MAMDRLFLLMKEKGASDMFLAVNAPVHLKINGNLIPINQQRLDLDNINALLSEVIKPEQMDELKTTNELNMGIGVQNIGRFRLSAFRQRGSISAVIRFVPGVIPSFEDLGLPPILPELIMEKRGLILLVGATGSGKSTTIASMLDYRNERRSGHILTLEDPIEYLFRNKKSIVNQREIGTDTESLYTALRNSMRQAPDCILIGEIRDRETMSAALAYAQSGHLVLATLHANNSYNALNRIISFYQIENRPALLQDLSSTIKAIISQRLIRSINGGSRTPAVEVMVNTRHISDLIEKGEIGEIKDALEKSLSAGLQSFESALMQLVKDGQISQEDALANADSASNLMWMLNNSNETAPAPTETKTKTTSETSSSYTEFTINI
jgi:twitching motility protein PilU